MQNKTNTIASIHLGKKSIGSVNYDPSLLVAIERIENREQYNIDENNLPFLGCDVWHCYEFSALSKNNLPISRVLKIKYDCNSKFLVESKSLKLYLNSFNMSQFGENIDECLAECKALIQKDLSNALQTEVKINFLDDEIDATKIFSKFQNILKFVDEKSLVIDKFQEAPELLKIQENDEKECYLKFSSLRSNCRVTHQPDFGDIFIYYKSKKHILEESLVQYLVSFRKENHFHEECVEMIYKRLFDVLNKDDELFVCALYTRRGGIDINPIRYSKNCKIEDYFDLVNLEKYTKSGIKQ